MTSSVPERDAGRPASAVAGADSTAAIGLARFLGVLLGGLSLVGFAGVVAAVIGAAVNGNSTPRLIANAALPGALLVVSLSARRCGSKRRAQVALCCVMSIVTLFVFAAALDVVRSDPFERKIRETLADGREFDERTVRRFVLDARNSGADMLPLLVPRALIQRSGEEFHSDIRVGEREVIPLSFVGHATVTLGNETGKHAVVKLDRHGFNNPDEVWDLKAIDVAAVGDSFTMGKCVGASENAIARIREAIPATVNLGLSGNSPLCDFATLVEYAAPLKPKTVLWLHYANDLAPYEMTQDEQTPLLMRYLEPGFSQHLEEIRPQIEATLRERAEAELAKPGADTCWESFRALRGSAGARARRVLLLSDLRSMLASAFGEPLHAWSPDVASYAKVLKEARDRVAAWGGRFVWVCVPDVEEFDANAQSDLAPVFRVRAELLATVRSLGIETVDLKLALASGRDPHSLYAWGRTSAAGLPHLTSEGYAVAAAEILKHLPPTEVGAPRDQGGVK
jgi:hypothetical protein